MSKILDMIYDLFIQELKDLQLGHMFDDGRIAEIYDLINVYELLDSNTLSLTERKQILNYYD